MDRSPPETRKQRDQRRRSYSQRWEPVDLLLRDEIARRAAVYPDPERQRWIVRACLDWRRLREG